MASVRRTDKMLPDTYYEGMSRNYVKDRYDSFSELICLLPRDMAKEFLMEHGGRLYVKNECFDEWMETIVSIPPSVVIAGYFSDRFTLECLHAPRDLYDFVRMHLAAFQYTTLLHPYMPELKFWVKKTNGLNDLHIHLNGSTETEAVWNYMLNHQDYTIRDFKTAYGKMASVRQLAEQILPDFTPARLKTLLEHSKTLQKRIITLVAQIELHTKAPCTKIEYLWGNFASADSFGPLIEEILLQLFCLAELRMTKNVVLARMLHHYLLLKGLIRQFCVQQQNQIGFSQFQMMTDNTFREAVEKNYERRFLQLAGSDDLIHLRLVEGRFSPKDTPVKNYILLTKIKKGFNEALAVMEKQHRGLQRGQVKLALVAHFIKKGETKKSKRVEIRHHSLREDLRKRSIALAQVLKTSMGKQLIVGIDAAASELDAGPEVFAPTYRYLSRHGVAHFTYHAGEDFRHLLSGIRAIYETVTFLRLEPGCRIGHGTALGIDPDLWCERLKGVCYVQQGEWLDDLLFVWSLIRYSGNVELHVLIPKIESDIAELCYSVYGETLHPSLLVRIWELREYAPGILLGKIDRRKALELYPYEELMEIMELMKQDDIKRIVLKYHAPSEGSIFSRYRLAYDKLIEVDIKSLFDMNQLKDIQDVMLEFLSKKGIVIEALPTSNMRISYYQNFSEYHLERWVKSNPNVMRPPVVLGSDDPGIFMTNIYNEYARIYRYLEGKNYSSTERIEIIRQIHENSEIYKFFDND